MIKVRKAILYSILFSYAKIAKDSIETMDKELIKFIDNIIKKENKFRLKLTNKEIEITNNKFQHLKETELEYFADNDFSSIVMVILVLNYLQYEDRDEQIRVHLGHIDTFKYLNMIEGSKIRTTTMFHHRALETILIEMGL